MSLDPTAVNFLGINIVSYILHLIPGIKHSSVCKEWHKELLSRKIDIISNKLTSNRGIIPDTFLLRKIVDSNPKYLLFFDNPVQDIANIDIISVTQDIIDNNLVNYFRYFLDHHPPVLFPWYSFRLASQAFFEIAFNHSNHVRNLVLNEYIKLLAVYGNEELDSPDLQTAIIWSQEFIREIYINRDAMKFFIERKEVRSLFRQVVREIGLPINSGTTFNLYRCYDIHPSPDVVLLMADIINKYYKVIKWNQPACDIRLFAVCEAHLNPPVVDWIKSHFPRDYEFIANFEREIPRRNADEDNEGERSDGSEGEEGSEGSSERSEGSSEGEEGNEGNEGSSEGSEGSEGEEGTDDNE